MGVRFLLDSGFGLNLVAKTSRAGADVDPFCNARCASGPSLRVSRGLGLPLPAGAGCGRQHNRQVYKNRDVEATGRNVRHFVEPWTFCSPAVFSHAGPIIPSLSKRKPPFPSKAFSQPFRNYSHCSPYHPVSAGLAPLEMVAEHGDCATIIFPTPPF